MRRKYQYNRFLHNKSLLTFKYYLLNSYAIINKPNNPPNNPAIFNLTKESISSLIPSKNLLNAIKQGVKYIPKQHSATSTEIIQSIEDTIARLSWKIINKDKYDDDDEFYDPAFKINKRPNTCHQLKQNTLITDLRQELIRAAIPYQNQSNPDPITKQLIRMRIDNPQLIFKQSDKNLGLTIMHLSQYDELIRDHLDDPNIYKRISTTKTFLNSSKFRGIKNSFKSLQIHILNEFRNLPDQIIKFLKKKFSDATEFDLPAFHVIPKLHKKGKLKSRPIVGAINWYSTPISKVLDHVLKPFIDKKHILKDTKNLIKEFKTITLTKNEILVSMDVTALYTNMLTEKLKDLISAECNPATVKMLNFILKNNYFEYGDYTYLQKDGIAMGTNAAPTLANFYVDRLIDKHLIIHENINNYYRFIDDIFFTWNGTLDQLESTIQITNNRVGKLNFTYKTNYERVEFLDLNIIKRKDNNKLDFYTYQKGLNKYSYITSSSCHPESTIKGFIKGELIRFKRNSSNSFYFNHTKNLFKDRLKNRGYREKFLSDIFNNITYESKITTNNKEVIKIPFIIPYSTHQDSKLVRNNIKNIEKYAQTSLPNSRIINAYSIRKNIGQILIRSKLSREQIDILYPPKNRETEPKPQDLFPATKEFLAREALPKVVKIPKPIRNTNYNKSAFAHFTNPNRNIISEETEPTIQKRKLKPKIKHIKLIKGQSRISDFFK